MNERAIVPVAAGAQRRCVGTLIAAFADDPVARWLFPEPGQYLDHFPRLVGAFAEPALEAGTAFQVDGFAGAAVWLAPGQEPDEDALAEAIGQGVSAERQAAVLELLGRMAEAHPKEAHWYLPLIGVEPAYQGRGYGSALLSQVSKVCDREGLPAYLEATSPANVALYRRHGFRPLGLIQAQGSPPLVSMEREPGVA